MSSLFSEETFHALSNGISICRDTREKNRTYRERSVIDRLFLFTFPFFI